MDIYVIMWLAVFAMALIVEYSTESLVCVFFVPSAIVCAILAAFGSPVFAQIIVFFALSVALLILFRESLSEYVYSRKKDVLTPLDSIVGKVVRVEEEIDNFNSKGRVILNCQSWQARSADNKVISTGSMVIIEKVEGAKLICRYYSKGDK